PGEGVPSFRLIADQDLPSPLYKDTRGMHYGSVTGGSVTAESATLTMLAAREASFDTLTIAGRRIGAAELEACIVASEAGLPQSPAVADVLPTQPDAPTPEPEPIADLVPEPVMETPMAPEVPVMVEPETAPVTPAG
ncbi:MAG TPA: hypothetical protein VGB97_02985, partial [Candidatus Paceibacterota bacterium]